jgi:hypothetical protein
MEAPVDEADLRQVEDFYARRGASPILATCPFADPPLFALLAKRGWRITEFENVLALELGEAPVATAAAAAGPDGAVPSGAVGNSIIPIPTPMEHIGSDISHRHQGKDDTACDLAVAGVVPEPLLSPGLEVPGMEMRGLEVRVASPPEERALWGRIAARGFSDEGEPGVAQEEFGSLMAARRDAILVLGWVDGQPAGTGALGIDGTVGWLGTRRRSTAARVSAAINAIG